MDKAIEALRRSAIYRRNSKWFEQFRAPDQSDEMDFSVERHDRAGRYFSKEALEEMNDGIAVFIGARMMAHADRTGQPPAKAKVTVKVEFE